MVNKSAIRPIVPPGLMLASLRGERRDGRTAAMLGYGFGDPAEHGLRPSDIFFRPGHHRQRPPESLTSARTSG
jgi:hypothetical protein